VVELDSLVERTVAGDTEGWKALQTAIEPRIAAIVRGHNELRNKRLASSPDAQREITVSTFERLARRDFHNLREYLRGPKDGGERRFDSWLYGAVHFEALEYLRKELGRAPDPKNKPSWPLPSKLDVNSPGKAFEDLEAEGHKALLDTISMTTKLTAVQIFEHIDAMFAADEARALRLYYLEDCKYETLADRLGLGDAKSAELLVRRLNARLRHHFALQTDQ
jgi:DNA-directed RNA polymerase specialized sigma24 family protein